MKLLLEQQQQPTQYILLTLRKTKSEAQWSELKQVEEVLNKQFNMAGLGKEFLEASMETDSPILDDEECLKERKWWCFLLRYIQY